eukprot:Seg1951.7 transcript_id=Seg1951.7/GoldUCD/mRNA.D3Y31 product="hypothetical protein" protein_id=Seg1951.7/GoldUCD/D3Y31
MANTSEGAVTVNSDESVRTIPSPPMEWLLDLQTRSEINSSVESLKRALLTNIEKTLKRSSKNLTAKNQASSGEEKKVEANGNAIGREEEKQTAGGNDFVRHSDSLRDIASIYLKDRQNLKKSVMSIVSVSNSRSDLKDSENSRLTGQQQMRIWTDVATDLDGYYLEMLNRYLRIGRIEPEDMTTGNLLTYRVSESVVDDLDKNKRKQIFQSQQDVHDDVTFGHLHANASLDDITMNDFIEGLLARTNMQRQKAIWHFDYEVGNDNEDGSDNDEIEASADSKKKKPSVKKRILSRNASIENSVRSLHDVIKTYKTHIDKQNDELGDRKEIIETLIGDNKELKKGLEMSEKRQKDTEKQKENELITVRSDYLIKLTEKNSEIAELQRKISEIPQNKKGEMGKWRLENSFIKACEGLEHFADEVDAYKASTRDEEKGQLGVEESEEQLPMQGDQFKRWLIGRMLELCEKTGCTKSNKQNDSTNQYIDSLFLSLFKAADTNKETLKSFAQETNKVRANFKSLRNDLAKAERKLWSVTKSKYDLQAQLAEKGDEITVQAELLNQKETELTELRSQNESLDAKYSATLSDLNAAQERLVSLEEELRQEVVIEQQRGFENELILDYLVENMHEKGSVIVDKFSSSQESLAALRSSPRRKSQFR